MVRIKSIGKFVSVSGGVNESVNSKIAIVKMGVPQGSVQGPRLLNIFVNDSPSHVAHKLSMYADITNDILVEQPYTIRMKRL